MAFSDIKSHSFLLSPPERYHKIHDSNSSSMASKTSFAVRQDHCNSYNPSVLPVLQALPLSPISPDITFIDESGTCTDLSNGEKDPQLFPGTEPVVHGPLFPNGLLVDDDFKAIVRPESNKVDIRLPIEGLPLVSCMWDVVKEQNAVPGQKPSIILEMERRAEALRRRKEETRTPLAPKRMGIEKRLRKPEFPPEQRRSFQTEQPRVQRVKRTPNERVLESFELETTPLTPQSPPQKKATREDTDWESIPDFCPPISSLGDPSASAKNVFVIEWKSSPLDLSTDPNRHLLHPGELHLAQTLRLTCATYLCSKRRIFQARVECRRRGKEFRKTDAQQACKIDVNKASRLHSAFSKKNLFDNKWSDRFM